MLIIARLAAFALILLLLDFFFSFLSTCDPASFPNPAGLKSEEYCSPFRGPITSSASAFGKWSAHVLEEWAERLIALFTIVLAISTIALWRSTKHLWEATRIAAEHIPTTERAYIFGGPGILENDSEGQFFVGVTMANYGKTPGFLKRVSWGLCPEKQWPKSTYDHEQPWDDIVFPDMKVPMDMRIRCALTGTEPLIFYGRFDYTDIFREKRHSIWRHRMMPPNWGNIPLEGAYTEWT